PYVRQPLISPDPSFPGDPVLIPAEFFRQGRETFRPAVVLEKEALPLGKPHAHDEIRNDGMRPAERLQFPGRETVRNLLAARLGGDTDIVYPDQVLQLPWSFSRGFRRKPLPGELDLALRPQPMQRLRHGMLPMRDQILVLG